MSEPVDGPIQSGVEMGPGHGGQGLPNLSQPPSRSHPQSDSQSQSHPSQPQRGNNSDSPHSDSEPHAAQAHPMNIDSPATEGPSPNIGLASANSSTARDVDAIATEAISAPSASASQTVGDMLAYNIQAEGLRNANLAKRQGLPAGPMVPASVGGHTDSQTQPTFNLVNASLLKQAAAQMMPSIIPPVVNPPTLLSTMSALDTAAVPTANSNTAYSQSPMQLSGPVIPLSLSSSNPAGVPILPNLSLPQHPQVLPNAQTSTLQSTQPSNEFADMKHPYQVEPINTTSVGISTIGTGHDAIPVIISTTTTTITTTTITPIDPSQVPSAMALASAGMSVPNGQSLSFIPSGTNIAGSLPFPMVQNLHPQSPTSASSFSFSEGSVAKAVKSSPAGAFSGPLGGDVGTQKKELEARGEVT